MLRNALHTFTVVTPKEQVLAHCIGEIEALALPCSLQPNLPLYVKNCRTAHAIPFAPRDPPSAMSSRRFEIIPALPCLQTLTLSRNLLGPQGMQARATSLATVSPHPCTKFRPMLGSRPSSEHQPNFDSAGHGQLRRHCAVLLGDR